MSLSFDLRDIKNKETVCYVKDEDLRGVTMGIIHYAGLVTGIPNITQKNWEEFFARAHIWDTIVGGLLQTKPGTPVDVTREQVQSHVGLKTNGSTFGGREFLKRMRENAYRLALERKREALLEAARKVTLGEKEPSIEGHVYALMTGGSVLRAYYVCHEGAWKRDDQPGLADAEVPVADRYYVRKDATALTTHCRACAIYVPEPQRFFP